MRIVLTASVFALSLCLTGCAGKQAQNFTSHQGMEFVQIPAGSFMMGCSEGDGECSDQENPRHQVTISKPFYMGKYEVTQEEWEKVMGNNPSQFKGPKRPVENVSWDDVQEFLGKLNQSAPSGKKYRLPTEAEWAYAARAGSTTKYSFGGDAAKLGDYAWFEGNSGKQTHPVGQKLPNAWDLYDMHGNVFEWVQDWFGKYGSSPETDPTGPVSGSSRAIRGGSWFIGADRCRSAYRSSLTSDSRRDRVGFRVVLVH